MSLLADSTFPGLFRHSKRSDWGVAVLAAQFEGKRSYLFEDGEERTLGVAGIQLMRKVEEPDSEERATCAHLISRLCKRSGKDHVDVGADGVAKQLERFLERYESGFSGAAWRSEKRGGFARCARLMVPKAARSQLSLRSLEPLLARGEFTAIWQAALEVVKSSGLAIQLGPIPGVSEQPVLAQTVFDLLHGHRSFDYRFDRWVSTYQAVFSEAPTWPAATVLPALLSPVEHLIVDVSAFRRQLTILKRQCPLGGRPSGATYTRCLAAARSLANLLAAQGQVPRDLLDVHDFIRCSQ